MRFNRNTLDNIIEGAKASWERIGDLERIPELLDPRIPFKLYKTISKKKALEKLVGDAQILIGFGAYFGDEAKGKVGNALCEIVDAVFRLTGGANTGRTVYDAEGNKLVLHVTPTSVISNKECYIGPEVLVDPIALMEDEIATLQKHGHNYDNLHIGNVHIVSPYHRIMDFLGSPGNTSTGVGMRPKHKSISGRTSVRLNDIFDTKEHLRDKLKRDVAENYRGFFCYRELSDEEITQLREEGDTDVQITPKDIVKLLEKKRETDTRLVPDDVLEFAKRHAEEGEDSAIDYLLDLYEDKVRTNEQFPHRENVVAKLNQYLEDGKRVLIEPTQSHFLSRLVEIFYGRGTSPDTTTAGTLAAGVISPEKYKVKIFPIFKFPSASRVGRGNIPGSFTLQDFFSRQNITCREDVGNVCDDFDEVSQAYFDAIAENGLLMPNTYIDADSGLELDIGSAMAISSSRKHGEEGATTGKPRVTGLFDCVLAAHIAKLQGSDGIISCLDRGDDCENVGLVVGYVVDLPDEQKEEFRSDDKGMYIDSDSILYRTGDVIKPGEDIPDMRVLKYCKPIVKAMAGWKDCPVGADNGFKTGDYLPAPVSELFSAIKFYSGIDVISFGNGKNTEDLQFTEEVGLKTYLTDKVKGIAKKGALSLLKRAENAIKNI